MARKIRSDIKIGNLEKKLGLNKGAIRNPDGTDARSDKKLGTLQNEYERLFAGPPVRTNSTNKNKSVKKVPILPPQITISTGQGKSSTKKAGKTRKK